MLYSRVMKTIIKKYYIRRPLTTSLSSLTFHFFERDEGRDVWSWSPVVLLSSTWWVLGVLRCLRPRGLTGRQRDQDSSQDPSCVVTLLFLGRCRALRHKVGQRQSRKSKCWGRSLGDGWKNRCLVCLWFIIIDFMFCAFVVFLLCALGVCSLFVVCCLFV